MAIIRVWIEPGCILCHSSVGICPDVFEVVEGAESARVRPDARLAGREDDIRLAAENCPAQVIRLEER